MTNPTIDEVKESLFLQSRHSCCDDAAQYLWPPSRGTGEQFVAVQLAATHLLVKACDVWTFDIGDGRDAPVIKFCPFCGEELPR